MPVGAFRSALAHPDHRMGVCPVAQGRTKVVILSWLRLSLRALAGKLYNSAGSSGPSSGIAITPQAFARPGLRFVRQLVHGNNRERVAHRLPSFDWQDRPVLDLAHPLIARWIQPHDPTPVPMHQAATQGPRSYVNPVGWFREAYMTSSLSLMYCINLA